MRSTARPFVTLLPVVIVVLLAAAGFVPPAGSLAAQAPQADTDRLIVTLAPAMAPQAAARPALVAAGLSADAGAQLSYVRPLGDGAHVLALDGPRSAAELAEIGRRLTATPAVLLVEPDTIVFPTREPSDSGYQLYGWHLKGVGSSYGANLPAAWTITTGSPAIGIAVIDTGARLDHEDLAGRSSAANPGYDLIGDLFKANDGDGRDGDPSDPGDYVTAGEVTASCGARDSTWHGTHVAGTIGAQANNGRGMAGVNWVSPLLHVRALGKCGGYISDIVDGLRWAVGLPVFGLPANPNPARVLNLSLGGSGRCGSSMQLAIDEARSLGATVVVAAGNDNTSASNATPGNCAGVITVGATNQFGGRASYSNYGPAVELAAPGGDSAVDSMVYSTLNSGAQGPAGDSYGFYQGTSMATPHVAGVVSLMLAVNPGLASDEILSIVQSTATRFPTGSSCASGCGAGILNAGEAVEEAARRVRSAGFEREGVVVTEGDGTLRIPLSLSVPSNRAVELPYTLGGTANGADHNLVAGSVGFAPGSTTATLELTIANDSIGEEDETLVIRLGPGARAGLGAVSSYTITIRDNDQRPLIGVTPTSMSFGPQRVATTSASQSLTISNAGELPLTLRGLALSGPFARAGGSCASVFPATLVQGASCSVALQFTPDRLGARGGSLRIESDAGGPVTVALGGNGVIPALGYGPTRLSFADLPVGAASPTGTLVLTNPGTAPLRIDGLATGGDYRLGAVSCAPTLPATLAPGASCTVELGFTPQAGGPRAGALTVGSDAPGGPYSVRLLGTGLAPALAIDALALNFGGQQTGATSAARTVTIANRGGAPLSLTSLAVGGAAFARAGGSCPTSLPASLDAGASCTVLLTFRPPSAQSHSGALSVGTAGGAGTARVELSGAGTTGPAASPQLSPALVSFDDRVLPAAAGARTITLGNAGAAPMTVSGIALNGSAFSLGGGSCGAPPFALAPGASCGVEVRLVAGATGAYSGTLTVSGDAPGGAQVTALAGSVVAGSELFGLDGLAVATTPTTATLRFTVSRAGLPEGEARVGYSVTADRPMANGDLVVAEGSVSFAAGESSRELSLSFDRLALYGATALVVALDEPIGVAGAAPGASRSIALPADGYPVYLPMVWR